MDLEKELARLDEWLLSTAERVGVGLVAGFLGSAVLRRRWPIVMGLGVALGQSVGDYRAEFNDDDKNAKDNGKSNGDSKGKGNGDSKDKGTGDSKGKGDSKKK